MTAAVSNQSATFLISDTKTCVSIVSLSTQNNKKTVFQRYPSKVSTETTNQYLGCSIDPSFWGISRLEGIHKKLLVIFSSSCVSRRL